MNEAQFVRSGAPHVVEVAQGSHDAKSKSAMQGTDAERTETDTPEFVHADPPTELKPLPFDHASTIPVSSPLVLNADEISPPPPRITSAPPVIPAAAATEVHASKPKPATRQSQSHFSDQIGTLKAENNSIRAELKRRESALHTKT